MQDMLNKSIRKPATYYINAHHITKCCPFWRPRFRLRVTSDILRKNPSSEGQRCKIVEPTADLSRWDLGSLEIDIKCIGHPSMLRSKCQKKAFSRINLDDLPIESGDVFILFA